MNITRQVKFVMQNKKIIIEAVITEPQPANGMQMKSAKP